jgi:hypothetical protein
MDTKTTSRDFAYWLQGKFEIDDGNNHAYMTLAQAKKILEKANSVDVSAGADVDNFVIYAKNLLFPAGENMGDSDFYSEAATKLRRKLNDLFVHAIDPTIQGDQTQLKEIHKPGGKKGGGGLEAMC